MLLLLAMYTKYCTHNFSHLQFVRYLFIQIENVDWISFANKEEIQKDRCKEVTDSKTKVITYVSLHVQNFFGHYDDDNGISLHMCSMMI
jgi:hypothetical protein